MSNPSNDSPAADGFAGFGKFVPGFDFLQNLVSQTAASAAKTATVGGNSGLQMPGLGGWIAPTMNVEELDRRIKELKAVQFWLDQNATALKATVTALEVQKMTLATLKDMNFNMNEVASAFQAKASESFASMKAAPTTPPAPDKGTTFAGLEVPTTVFGAQAAEAIQSSAPASEPEPAPQAPPPSAAPASAPAPGGVDPMQWWGALTQQFQTIASDAMKDVARQAAQVAPQQATAMAEKAAASVAATGKTFAAGMAEQATKNLAGGAAAISKALRQQAWPTPAGTPAKKSAPAPVKAKASVKAKSPAARPAAKPASKRAAPVAAKSGRAAPARAAVKTASRPAAKASTKKAAARPARKSGR
jgi:hypothetical protein